MKFHGRYHVDKVLHSGNVSVWIKRLSDKPIKNFLSDNSPTWLWRIEVCYMFRDRILKQVDNIIPRQLQFQPDGCSSFLPVYLLKESEVGSWTDVGFIIISVIKITPSEKNRKLISSLCLVSWIQNKWFS